MLNAKGPVEKTARDAAKEVGLVKHSLKIRK